jgi:peptide/nickel transport system permease protein
MTRFIIIRLLQTLIALFGISILIFVLEHASGDPTMLMRTPLSTEEDINNIRESLGLDKPAIEQYWIFIKGLSHGDLGNSLTKKRPITDMIMERIPASLNLGGISFVLGIVGALILGVLAAVRRDSIFDNGVKFVAILGQALPGFWVAIMAIYVFAVVLHLVPTFGYGKPINYVLPVLTNTFFLLPGMMRLVRSSMLDVLDSEYVKLARIKGLSERVVIWKHALRNALISPLTTAGMLFAGLITGSVIIENIFGWPGVGRLSIEAVTGRDFPLVQGITMMVAIFVLIVNLVVDIAYAWVDPQIRYQRT